MGFCFALLKHTDSHHGGFRRWLRRLRLGIVLKRSTDRDSVWLIHMVDFAELSFVRFCRGLTVEIRLQPWRSRNEIPFQQGPRPKNTRSPRQFHPGWEVAFGSAGNTAVLGGVVEFLRSCQQIAWFAVVASGNRPGFKLTCIVHKYRCRAVSLSSRQVVVGVLPILLAHSFVIIAEFVATVWLMFWQLCWSIFLFIIAEVVATVFGVILQLSCSLRVQRCVRFACSVISLRIMRR